MAAKDSKGTSSINSAEYFSVEGKTLIDISKLNELQADKKRVKVINMDTIFDIGIQQMLLFHFSRKDKIVEKLFEPSIGGPLVSLTHKARLLYALGLINKITLNDLEQIHRIRNIFAHSVEASFADSEVVKFVGKLSVAKGQTITAKNSYKFYQRALSKCSTSLMSNYVRNA